jgi:hypothetical protein
LLEAIDCLPACGRATCTLGWGWHVGQALRNDWEVRVLGGTKLLGNQRNRSVDVGEGRDTQS